MRVPKRYVRDKRQLTDVKLIKEAKALFKDTLRKKLNKVNHLM
jgi:hypothetical protein